MAAVEIGEDLLVPLENDRRVPPHAYCDEEND